MNRDQLIKHLEKRYTSKRGMLSRIPLSIQPDPLWHDLLNMRRSRGTILPLNSYSGASYWFVTTDKMIAASEKVIETLYENETEFDPYTDLLPISTLEEIYYTSYVEGSQLSIQAAMDFLTSEQPPRDIEEQLITNNRAASSYASKNMFRKIDTDYLQELIFILTDGMDYGGSDFRTTDSVDFALMTEESYHFPSAGQIPMRMTQLIDFLDDPNIHPLIKAAAAQAWMIIVQPFPEGNERLGRVLSSIILLRAGYTFFSEVSLSALISRKSYGYYESIANILREENGFDLTYFIEYFLELLSRAIDERKLRKSKREEENRQAEIAMAHMPLVPTPYKEEAQEGAPDKADSPTDSPVIINPLNKTEIISDPATFQKETEEDESISPGNELNAPSMRGNPIEFLIKCSKKADRIGHLSLFIIKQIKEGKQYFWTHDAASEMNISSSKQLSSSFFILSKYGVLLKQKRQKGHSLYKITIENSEAIETIDTNAYPEINFYTDSADTDVITNTDDFPDTIEPKDTTEIENSNIELAKEQGYDPSILDMIQKLKNAQISSKDKRLGSMLALCLLSGEITKNDYEKHGHLNRWNPDMYLASQMGIVEKVNPHKYIILHKAKEGPVTLSNAQKKMITEIYESFGEESFSTEMVVATLDYTSPHVSAYLHKFTLLKILDCWKEHVNKYQFLISPEEYPEYFIQVA